MIMEVGLDLTNIKIEKFNDFNIIRESVSEDIEKVKMYMNNVGLDLTKESGNDIIDLTKYGKDIE